ncbi:dUTP diphosphatase [Jeotgalibacillus proteolyticus]|uniref:dUTP diphosphatase n=1 Tax=Jeotgalibacillus proteolyticus TaxID=2082395 RepID=UPI003CF2909B
MNWTKLYDMQQQLDAFIEKEKNIENQNLFDKKIVALFVEAGELANETRCFKFWSEKDSSDKDVILEEYVDGVHFLLSLGLEKGLRYEGSKREKPAAELTDQFKKLYGSIHSFAVDTDYQTYAQAWDVYLGIGRSLGFTEDEVMQAYVDKNEINILRQQQGY